MASKKELHADLHLQINSTTRIWEITFSDKENFFMLCVGRLDTPNSHPFSPWRDSRSEPSGDVTTNSSE